MYLDVPSSATKPSDVQLIFNFATGTNTRAWNIKIAMLPCGASYLAPSECLQYFTTASGRVKSFNWQDVATTTTRQLNNQNYKICFRAETLASGSSATQMCVSACTTTTPFVGFFLTGTGTAAVPADPSGTPAAVPAAAAAAGTGTAENTGCTYDFLAIAGGFDPVTGKINDRYCGGSLTSTSVCTKMRPFSLNFGTDDTEAAITPAVPPGKPVTQLIDNANTGFCLDYQEK
uniref:CUB domain-containing protein n=1 Tax=Daphnia galeata TaxID=27404 RepID=A0A8J2RPX2_9CRUS|nr:unnamed protein product [Daphnia galeata]